MSDSPRCQECGVCCFSSLDAYVRVTGEDWGRLGEEADQWAHFIGHRAYMQMVDGHCAALRQVNEAGSPRFYCSVYHSRPQVCRDLDRGSTSCEAERARKEATIFAGRDAAYAGPLAMGRVESEIHSLHEPG